MIGIQARKSLLTDNECLYLIQYISSLNEWTQSDDSSWKNRFLEAKDMSDSRAIQIMKKAYIQIKSLFNEEYDADSFRIVVWNEGDESSLHSDNVVEWRDFSSIVYLNDNFDGGRTEFPLQSISIKPESGLVIAFEGNERYPHLVTTIESGIRYTIASFWTKNKQHKFYEGWIND